MTTKIQSWGAAAALIVVAGCGGVAVIDPAEGGAFAAGGTGGTGTTGGTGGVGGTSGLQPCGGVASLGCGGIFYCDYQPSFCGTDDLVGVCRLRHEECPSVYRPVCGCDGIVYPNDCGAHVAGADVDWNGGCAPPASMFACGAGYCDAGRYCRVSLTDLAGLDADYACMPYPAGCTGVPDCSCLAGVACGEWCTDDGMGNLTVTCPAG